VDPGRQLLGGRQDVAFERLVIDGHLRGEGLIAPELHILAAMPDRTHQTEAHRLRAAARGGPRRVDAFGHGRQHQTGGLDQRYRTGERIVGKTRGTAEQDHIGAACDQAVDRGLKVRQRPRQPDINVIPAFTESIAGGARHMHVRAQPFFVVRAQMRLDLVPRQSVQDMVVDHIDLHSQCGRQATMIGGVFIARPLTRGNHTKTHDPVFPKKN